MMKKQGFTLIELSIVLVIIGLIVGGVLVGRDLIKAAEIRSQISQLEKYQTAVSTFRLKYNGIPGDLLSTQATSFGLFSISCGPALGCGNNDGLITQDGATGTNTFLRAETIVFYRHLSEAGLIDGNYSAGSSIDSTGKVVVLPTTQEMMNLYIPASKLASTSVSVGYVGSRNYFFLSGFNALASVGGNYTNGTNSVAGQVAAQIDTKVDDGVANTGSIAASDVSGGGQPSVAAWTSPSYVVDCTNGTGTTYNLTSITSGCSLRIRMSQ